MKGWLAGPHVSCSAASSHSSRSAWAKRLRAMSWSVCADVGRRMDQCDQWAAVVRQPSAYSVRAVTE